MINQCAHCGATNIQHGFNRVQCLNCGGFTLYTGQATVPTSGLEVGGTYDGPGADLITNPHVAPFAATAMVETLPEPFFGGVPSAPTVTIPLTDQVTPIEGVQ